MIIAQGGRFGGWAVYIKDGKAKFVYNVLGHPRVRHRGRHAVPPEGTHQVRMEFAYDGGGLAKGGDVTLYYDGDAGRHRPGRRHPAHDLLRGRDDRHRLRVRHHRHRRLQRSRRSRFTGKIHWVQLDVGTDDHDHFIDPTERLRVALARQ